MMFQRISRQIALQFTGFVFLLLLINGLLFLGADLGNARRQAHGRLLRTTQLVAQQAQIALQGGEAALPVALRESVRIVDFRGHSLHTGELFLNVPFDPREQLSSIVFEGERYNVLTAAIRTDGTLQGYVQVADLERVGTADLPLRAILYLAVSIAVSALIFGVGRSFARRSLKPAEQAMDQLEQFTQDASHELRTPLTAMNSSLDLALRSGNFKEGIESAKDDLKNATALLDRLLEIARLGPSGVDRSPINFSELTEQTVERFEPFAKENGVTIEKTIAPAITVQGDASLLRQVLTNLLQNAVKFKKTDGGKVRVVLTKQSLTIADDGVGIDAEKLSHVFDRFFQADPSRSRGGYGLGLPLVKRIVELHGWSIGLKSELGKGTQVTVRFAPRG